MQQELKIQLVLLVFIALFASTRVSPQPLLDIELGVELANHVHECFAHRFQLINDLEANLPPASAAANSDARATLGQLRADLMRVEVEALGLVNRFYHQLNELVFHTQNANTTTQKIEKKRRRSLSDVHSIGLDLTVRAMEQSQANYNALLVCVTRLSERLERLLLPYHRSAWLSASHLLNDVKQRLAAYEGRIVQLIHAAILTLNYQVIFSMSNNNNNNTTTKTRMAKFVASESLACAAGDSSVRVLSMTSGACVRTLTGHTEIVCALETLTSDSNSAADLLLASGSLDTTIRVWSLANATCLRTLSGHTGGVYALERLGGMLLASASDDKTVRIWNASSGELLTKIIAHAKAVSALRLVGSVSEGEWRLASGSWDRTVRIWSVSLRSTPSRLERTLTGHTQEVNALEVLHLRRQRRMFLVSSSSDNTIRLWNLDNGECVLVLGGHTSHVYALRMVEGLLGDEEAMLASGSFDGTVRLWRLSVAEKTGKLEQAAATSDLWTLTGHEAPVVALEVLGGGRIASAARGGAVRVWNVSGVSRKDANDAKGLRVALDTLEMIRVAHNWLVGFKYLGSSNR